MENISGKIGVQKSGFGVKNDIVFEYTSIIICAPQDHVFARILAHNSLNVYANVATSVRPRFSSCHISDLKAHLVHFYSLKVSTYTYTHTRHTYRSFMAANGSRSNGIQEGGTQLSNLF